MELPLFFTLLVTFKETNNSVGGWGTHFKMVVLLGRKLGMSKEGWPPEKDAS